MLELPIGGGEVLGGEPFLADSWISSRRYESETTRRAALPGYHFYNHHRTAIGDPVRPNFPVPSHRRSSAAHSFFAAPPSGQPTLRAVTAPRPAP